MEAIRKVDCCRIAFADMEKARAKSSSFHSKQNGKSHVIHSDMILYDPLHVLADVEHSRRFRQVAELYLLDNARKFRYRIASAAC